MGGGGSADIKLQLTVTAPSDKALNQPLHI